MDKRVENVFQYIDEHKNEYIGLFQDFVRQPSIAVNGKGIPEMIEMVTSALKRLGTEPVRYETGGNPIIYARIDGESTHTFGFYGHYDVQPEGDKELWKYGPYEAAIKDGVMYGRGCADNKNGLVAKLCAVDAWMKVYQSLPCTVKFFIEGEEEVGSPHLAQFAKEHAALLACDGFNWETGTKEVGGAPEISLGSKGMLYVELHVRTAQTDGHSRFAPIVDNAAWRLTQALATIKDTHDHILIDGFYDNIRKPTAAVLENLKHDNLKEEDVRKLFGLEQFMDGLTGELLLEKYYFSPTANICGISSGYTEQGSKAIVPCRADAKIDFRLVPGQEPEQILRLLRAHLDRHGFEDIEIEMLSAMPAYSTSQESPFFKIVNHVLTELFEAPVVHDMMTGTTPMPIFCKEQNIPVATFGCSSETAGIHAPNEHQDIGSWVDEIKIMAAVMHGIGALPE